MRVIDKDRERQLIDAANLLCQHVDENLAPGWEITMNMRHGEADIELTDPFGNTVETDAPDYGVSTLSDMCMASKEQPQ